jgi:hypothetical protein
MLSIPGRANWAQRYEELVEYKERHGDCCVPKAAGALGRWVARQREVSSISPFISLRASQIVTCFLIFCSSLLSGFDT